MATTEDLFFDVGKNTFFITNIFANPTGNYVPGLSTNHFYGYLGCLIAYILTNMGAFSAANKSLK